MRDDRDPMHGIGTRREPRHDRMAALVVRDQATLFEVGETRLPRAELNRVERLLEVLLGHDVAILARGAECRFVGQIGKIRS